MKINMKRIIKDIMVLSSFTSTPKEGVTRLPFTKEDKLARNYIKNEMLNIGLNIWEDGYSNLFGRLEGTNSEAPIIMIGSHYDSVINGGAFDGVAGLVAALEIARIIKEHNINHYNSIELVAMNDEEGVRFGTGISNSRAMVGLISEKELDSLKDSNNISLRKAMEDFGISIDLKNTVRQINTIKSFIELHVEQGPILTTKNIDIGIVENITGLNRYTVTFNGKAGHAGTTPMDKRKDALVAASHFILAINKVALDLTPSVVGTVGELRLSPNAPNVIPSKVKLSVDLRSTNESDLSVAKTKILYHIDVIKNKTNIDIELIEDSYIAPVPMSKEIIEKMELIADKLGYSNMRINSGAGHDAMIMARIAPSNMIFVPSKDGLSHHPDEWTDYEDLKNGIDLMMNLIIDLAN